VPQRLVVSSEFSRLNMQRPAGAAVYAGFVRDLLDGSGEIDLVDGRQAARADVILSLDGRFRAGRGQRTVTAILDLGHLFERGGYGLGEWLRQNWRVASAVRRSDHLLAPSEAVAFGLERYLRAPASRITVLPAVPRTCFRRPSREATEAVRRQLGLPPRYFLFVGSRSRRKNLGLLAAAWARAAPELGPDVGLVLAGPGGGAKGRPRSDAPAGVLDLGYVVLERLPPLLAGAVAWLGPSLYEGSPVGALEALACGTPALVAGTGAQPRAVGMAGLVLDPHDPAQWAQALVAVACSPELRSRLSTAALRSAADLRDARPEVEPLIRALRGVDAAGT
jgi:glycosyltransferase involved in cell wall biosynthesis